MSHDGKIKHLVLFDYGLLDKICDKIKYLCSIVFTKTALFINLKKHFSKSFSTVFVLGLCSYQYMVLSNHFD